MNYGLNLPQKGAGGNVGRGTLDMPVASRARVGDSSVLQDGQAPRPPSAPVPYLYAAQDREGEAVRSSKPAGGFASGHWYGEQGAHAAGPSCRALPTTPPADAGAAGARAVRLPVPLSCDLGGRACRKAHPARRADMLNCAALPLQGLLRRIQVWAHSSVPSISNIWYPTHARTMRPALAPLRLHQLPATNRCSRSHGLLHAAFGRVGDWLRQLSWDLTPGRVLCLCRVAASGIPLGHAALCRPS